MPSESKPAAAKPYDFPTFIIDSGKTAEERTAIKAHWDKIMDPALPPAKIEQSIQALGKHIRGLTQQQRQEIRLLYHDILANVVRDIEDGKTMDNRDRFRLRTMRLMVENAGIEPKEVPLRPRPPIETPREQPFPIPSSAPFIGNAGQQLIRGGDEVAVVTGHGLPQGTGPGQARH